MVEEPRQREMVRLTSETPTTAGQGLGPQTGLENEFLLIAKNRGAQGTRHWKNAVNGCCRFLPRFLAVT